MYKSDIINIINLIYTLLNALSIGTINAIKRVHIHSHITTVMIGSIIDVKFLTVLFNFELLISNILFKISAVLPVSSQIFIICAISNGK